MAQQKMYPAKNNSPTTFLTASISASSATMTVDDASVFPTAPNLAVIGDSDDAEIVLYTAINGTTLTITRAQHGTTASAWSARTPVARNFTSYDHDIFKENIEDLESRKVNKSGDTMTGNLVVTNSQPVVRLVPSDTSKMKFAQITISGNNRFMFWQDTPDGNGHVLYRLPETDTSATGNNYYDILTSKNFDTTPTASSSNPVTSGGVKNAVDGKVSKTGDTMTGHLSISRDSDKMIRFLDGSDALQGLIYLNNTNHTLNFRSYDNDYSNYETYALPSPGSLTSNKSYNVLTSKNIDTTPTSNSSNPVTSGGVKNAVDGKVSKTGDTINGNLFINGDQVIRMIPPNTSKMQYSQIHNRNNERMAFGQKSAAGGLTEYQLPVVDANTTDTTYIDILTGNNSGVQTLTGSAFTGTLQYQTIGKFGMISGTMKLTADLTDAYIDLQTIPLGYRPSMTLSGICGGQDGWGVISIYTSGVIRFYKAQNVSWPSAANIYFSFFYFVA